MKKLQFLSSLFCLLFLFSCTDDDPVTPPEIKEPDPTIIIADAGLNQNVDPLKLVTLDGTSSIGPEGFTYSWSYSGDIPESEIQFENKNTATPTFLPQVNGIYNFTLTIATSDTSDSDQVAVYTSGAIRIGGRLTEDLKLKNIQPDASLPDYIVTSDLIIPNGLTLSVIEDNVVIEFQSEIGLIVQDGGVLSNLNVEHGIGFETEFRSNEEWKGILVDNGSIALEDALIINSGKIAFDNQSEAAAITLAGDHPNIESFSNNKFENSLSYDIHVTGTATGAGKLAFNEFSYRIPIKAPITFMEFWNSDLPNTYPAYYDYVHLIPSGSTIQDAISGSMVFSSRSKGKYYIDGNLWAGSPIIVGSGCTIYIKENCGIYAQEGFSSQGTSSSPVIIAGIDSKTWKGIASVTTRLSSGSYSYTTIKNAGYGIIDIGNFQADASAAIYMNKSGSLKNSRIVNCGGFGLYDVSNSKITYTITDNTFENLAQSAIRTDAATVGTMIKSDDHGNIFNLNNSMPTVLIQGDAQADLSWYDLGGDNYYLVDTDLDYLDLYAGVHLKIKKGKAIYWNIPESYATIMYLRGTALNPVIIEGELDQPGSWGGMFLRGSYRFDNVIIRNGGEFPVSDNVNGLTANIVSTFNGNEDFLPWIKNSTISNSAGWGIIFSPNSITRDFNNPINGNTFEKNSNGDIIELN